MSASLARESWDTGWPREIDYAQRGATDTVVVHHSAGPRDQSIEEIRSFHVDTRGWLDIGYHFVIRLGLLYTARPLYVIGAHCRHRNARSVGVCVLGDYSSSAPEPQDRRALLQLLAHLLELWPGAEILGHVEAQSDLTACPGRLLEGVREELPTTPGWRGYGVRPLLT